MISSSEKITTNKKLKGFSSNIGNKEVTLSNKAVALTGTKAVIFVLGV